MNEEAISGVMGELMFLGRACAGCQQPVAAERGVSCFCADELASRLSVAHTGLLWCAESCLINTHEEPTWPDLDELKWKE